MMVILHNFRWSFQGNALRQVPQSLTLLLIRFYQKAVSPYLPASCRYVPSCSAYAYEAVRKYGVRRGVFLALNRILRCHPFHPGGYDPVP